MKKAALLSVSDRTGLIEFASGLSSLGYALLATSGTSKILKEHGIEPVSIEEYTGQKEILDGRVKTLHPKIHAGILARKDNKNHMAELDSEGIYAIDVVTVNFYPFLKYVESEKAKDPLAMVELVDVGGPTMIRAAAKNFSSVFPVIDPADYASVLSILKEQKGITPDSVNFRRKLAIKVFESTANYDLHIAKYFSGVSAEIDNSMFSSVQGFVLNKEFDLRYGENPHQQASFYRRHGDKSLPWEQLSGKTLSYNNLLDFDAAIKLLRSLPQGRPTSVIIKHLNPCGVASGNTLLESLKRAKLSDPRSHFGGILGFNSEVNKDVAEEIREDFAEIVLAPSYAPDALDALKKNKNLRVMKYTVDGTPSIECRFIEGGVLLQEIDLKISTVKEGRVVSEKKPTEKELNDLELAWILCAHTKSNAVTLVKDGMLIGSGAGQMSRVDSVEIAISKAKRHGHDLKGAVAASDAFFPFPDSVETLAEAGIKIIISTEGAKRDEDVIATANKCGVALVFAKDRHFRH